MYGQYFLLKAIGSLCVCVQTCVVYLLVYVGYMPLHAHRDQKLTLGVFRNHSPPYFVCALCMYTFVFRCPLLCAHRSQKRVSASSSITIYFILCGSISHWTLSLIFQIGYQASVPSDVLVSTSHSTGLSKVQTRPHPACYFGLGSRLRSSWLLATESSCQCLHLIFFLRKGLSVRLQLTKRSLVGQHAPEIFLFLPPQCRVLHVTILGAVSSWDSCASLQKTTTVGLIDYWCPLTERRSGMSGHDPYRPIHPLLLTSCMQFCPNCMWSLWEWLEYVGGKGWGKGAPSMQQWKSYLSIRDTLTSPVLLLIPSWLLSVRKSNNELVGSSRRTLVESYLCLLFGTLGWEHGCCLSLLQGRNTF